MKDQYKMIQHAFNQGVITLETQIRKCQVKENNGTLTKSEYECHVIKLGNKVFLDSYTWMDFLQWKTNPDSVWQDCLMLPFTTQLERILNEQRS